MTVQLKPEEYHTLTPYLIVPGVGPLIEFLKTVFDAEVVRAPFTRPDGSIMHAEVRVGDSRLMMGEPTEEWHAVPAAIYVYVTNTDVTYHRAISAGATSLMEPADQFYGDRSAGVKDASGNTWFIATHKEDLSPEEIEKRRLKAMADSKRSRA
jgi:PhnB protein